MKRRHVAQQWELDILEERPRARVELPPRRSLIRIAGSATDCNGVFEVASAMHLPGGGMFLGLVSPKGGRKKEEGRKGVQEELSI
jgi:hypothetical protein